MRVGILRVIANLSWQQLEPGPAFAVMPSPGISREAAMADLWRQVRGDAADDMSGAGDEGAAYIAGWALSCIATLGAVFAVWQFAL
jgi:hypothetical protein